ncbi:MAG: hypothetical protein QF429_00430, partial [Candidatus Nitrosopelagicus sp.]|nr:hypothetical protein [Candidatus Nitrosopelagicus sp.]
SIPSEVCWAYAVDRAPVAVIATAAISIRAYLWFRDFIDQNRWLNVYNNFNVKSVSNVNYYILPYCDSNIE